MAPVRSPKRAPSGNAQQIIGVFAFEPIWFYSQDDGSWRSVRLTSPFCWMKILKKRTQNLNRCFLIVLWVCPEICPEIPTAFFQRRKIHPKNPPKTKKFIWTSFAEQIPLGSWLVSQESRESSRELFENVRVTRKWPRSLFLPVQARSCKERPGAGWDQDGPGWPPPRDLDGSETL